MEHVLQLAHAFHPELSFPPSLLVSSFSLFFFTAARALKKRISTLFDFSGMNQSRETMPPTALGSTAASALGSRGGTPAKAPTTVVVQSFTESLPGQGKGTATGAATPQSPTANPAIFSSSARFLAAHTTDLHRWVLAVQEPKQTDEWSSTADGQLGAESVASRVNQSTAGSTFGNPEARQALPLEERIGLPELRVILRAFQNSTAPPQPPKPVLIAVSPTEPKQGKWPWSTTQKPKPPITTVRKGEERQTDDAMASSVARLSAVLMASKGDGTSRTNDIGFDVGDPTLTLNDIVGHLSGSGSAQPSSAPAPRAASSIVGKGGGNEAEDKSLCSGQMHRDAFVKLMKRLVPSATLDEIHTLLNKAISETQDIVSWNELATFLITRSRQKADIALDSRKYVLAGGPCNLHSEEQHGQAITCFAIEPIRRLIVTGCSSGTVRVWSSGSDLAYRGLLFSTKGWIVSLQWGYRWRVLYVITMHREVFVLDGISFDVLRIFRGRAITPSRQNLVYARETAEMVRVGGVASRNQGRSKSKFQVSGLPGKGLREERKEERMQRLLTSALHVRCGGTAASQSPGQRKLSFSVISRRQSASASPPLTLATTTATASTQYILTTGSAAEALHQENTPLTGPGRGPYLQQCLEESVLVGLNDAITTAVLHFSALEEEALLFGTDKGDVFLFILSERCRITSSRVLTPRHVFHQLHRGSITKMDFLLSWNALLSSGDDGKVIATSLVTGETLRTFYDPQLPEQHRSVIDFAVHTQQRMLLTVGPERQGLVWELAQSSPVAVLDPHNSPCCCAAFTRDQVITVSRDGALFVFDLKGFRRTQELELEAGIAIRTSTSAVAHIWSDVGRQRLLCFGNYPFCLRIKRQVSATCPARYRGHHSSMFASLYSRTFAQLVTISIDGIVMTWRPEVGKSEFSFLLSDVSDAVDMSSLRPTAVALDLHERRLLTGFHNGVVVVWNVLNGQVVRVLQVEEEALRSIYSKYQSPSTATQGQEDRTSQGAITTSGAVAIGSSSDKLEITAVASFLRSNTMSIFYAVPGMLFMAPEESEDHSTMASSKWPISPAYGEVVSLTQVAPQVVACGTASGAILFYHVLSEGQEGAALWVKEAMLRAGELAPLPTTAQLLLNGTLTGRLMSAGSRSRNPTIATASHGRGTLSRATVVPNTATSPTSRTMSNAMNRIPELQESYVTSRVVQLTRLPSVHPRLLLSVQEDGTISLWHTLRRVCLGVLNLTAAGVEESNTDEGVIVDIERNGKWIVFGDSGGNVHVCRAEWRVLGPNESEDGVLSLPNPVVYSAERRTTTGEGAAVMEDTAPGGVVDEDRRLFVFERFERIHVFHSALSLLRVTIIKTPQGTPTESHAASRDGAASPTGSHVDAVPERACSSSGLNDSRQMSNAAPDQLLIACTGTDHYVRIFTLAGIPIGELGMDIWDVNDPNTFRFMGEVTTPPAVPLPCPLASEDLDGNLFFDYMEEMHTSYLAAQQILDGMAMGGTLNGVLKRRSTIGRMNSRTPGVKADANELTQRYPPALTPNSHDGTPEVSSGHRFTKTGTESEASIGVSPKAASGGTVGSPVKLKATVPLLNAMRATLRATTSAADALDSAAASPKATIDVSRPASSNPRNACSSINGLGETTVPSYLTTHLSQSTRHRFAEEQNYKGMVKPAYVQQLRWPHTAQSTPATARGSDMAGRKGFRKVSVRPLSALQHEINPTSEGQTYSNNEAAFLAAIHRASKSPSSDLDILQDSNGRAASPRRRSRLTLPCNSAADTPHIGSAPGKVTPHWSPTAEAERLTSPANSSDGTTASPCIVDTSLPAIPSFTPPPGIERETPTSNAGRDRRFSASVLSSVVVSVVPEAWEVSKAPAPFSMTSFVFDSVPTGGHSSGKAVPRAPLRQRLHAEIVDSKSSATTTTTSADTTSSKQNPAMVSSFLSRERGRLKNAALSPRLRVQVAELSIAAELAGMNTATNRDADGGAGRGQQKAGGLHRQIDALLERRRTKLVFGEWTAGGAAETSKGFLAKLTAKMHYDQIEQTIAPLLIQPGRPKSKERRLRPTTGAGGVSKSKAKAAGPRS